MAKCGKVPYILQRRRMILDPDHLAAGDFQNLISSSLYISGEIFIKIPSVVFRRSC